jgi:hypothetical protein
MNSTYQFLISEIDKVLALLNKHIKGIPLKEQKEWAERIDSCLDERNRLKALAEKNQICS